MYINSPQKAFDYILNRVDKLSKKYDDFLLLKGRHILINEQLNKNIISRNECEIELNKINNSFFALLNDGDDDEDSIFEISKKSNIAHYENEFAAHEDIKNEILRSKKIKLHLIRGTRLFKEDEGLFYLGRYLTQGHKINSLLNVKILFMNFSDLSEDDYTFLTQNINVKWKELIEDKNGFHKTIERIKALNEDFDIKVKLYEVKSFHYFKLYIFDDACFFTVYHKLGKAKEHQQYPIFKIGKDTPFYSVLESVFDMTWDKSTITIK